MPPSILVVDDEPDNFDVIEALLHSEGYELNYASCGQRALDYLDKFQPDVILLDVMMPNLSGIEVCRRIKAMPQWKTTPIVMVTALTDKQDLARCLDAGADDFVSKPVHRIELQARVRSMLRIKAQYDSVKALMQMREDMVNMVVHDMRNPLASILLITELVKMPDLTPQMRSRQAEQMSIAGHQLQMLIDSVLVMAKLESGNIQLEQTEIDLSSLCLSACKDLEPIAQQKQLKLVSHLPHQALMIRADGMIVRRVFDNLLSNAIKFSPKKSQIHLTVKPTQKGAQVAIADRGTGINPAMRQSIFNKYDVGANIQGIAQMGLGLAFCKLAVEAHGGSIWVEDNPVTAKPSISSSPLKTSTMSAAPSPSSHNHGSTQAHQGSIFMVDLPGANPG